MNSKFPSSTNPKPTSDSTNHGTPTKDISTTKMHQHIFSLSEFPPINEGILMSG